ncbi:MAG: hypothetical protein AAF734_03330, partial [Bacteroidota bacterium]
DDGNEQVIGSRKRSTGTLVMKYSKEGQLVWKLRGEEQEPLYSDNPQGSMEVDGLGNLYVYAEYTTEMVFGGVSTGKDNGTNRYLLKVNSNGQVAWLKRFDIEVSGNNTSTDGDIALAADDTFGYVTLSEVRGRRVALGDGYVIPQVAPEGSYVVLIKFGSEGSILGYRYLLEDKTSYSTSEQVNLSTKISLTPANEIFLTTQYLANQAGVLFMGKPLTDVPLTIDNSQSTHLLAKLDINEQLKWVSAYQTDRNAGIATEDLSLVEGGDYVLSMYNKHLRRTTDFGLTLWQKQIPNSIRNLAFALHDTDVYVLHDQNSSAGCSFTRFTDDLVVKPLEESNFCTGQTIAVPFELVCANSNRWRAELIDINNNNTVVATGVGTSSPIALTIPLALTGGEYIIRVVEDIELGDEFIGSSNYLTVNISASTLALAPLEEVDYCASQVVPYSFTESCSNPSLSYQLELSLPDQALFGTPPQVIAMDAAPSGEFTLPTDLVAGTYYVRVASSNGLYSNTQTLTIIGGTPQITLAGYSGDTGNNTTNGIESCSASAGNLSFEVGCPLAGSDYEVQLSNLNSATFAENPPVLGSGESSPIAVSNLPNEAGPYYLRVVSSEGVASDLLPITIKAPLSAATVTINPSGNLCTGQPVNLVATGNAAYTYEWTIEGQTYFGMDITHTIQFADATAQLTLRYQGCSLVIPISLPALSVSPSITLQSQQNPSCGDASDGQIVFSLFDPSGFDYQLYRNDQPYEATAVVGGFTGSYTYSDLPAGVYTLEVSNSQCSLLSDPVALTGQGPQLSEVCLSKIPCSNGTGISNPTLRFEVAYPNAPSEAGNQYQYQLFREGASTPLVSGLTAASANMTLDPADLVAGELLRL